VHTSRDRFGGHISGERSMRSACVEVPVVRSLQLSVTKSSALGVRGVATGRECTRAGGAGDSRSVSPMTVV
jgi:hypothetical protein